MTQHTLQPYRKFEITFINQLIKQDSYYLVSQSYRRANYETDHTKTPILFTPHKELAEAVKHYEYLKKHGDRFAARIDIRKETVKMKLIAMCYGNTDKAPYISLPFNLQYINNYLDHHYYEKIRKWVTKNRENWMIREHNSLQVSFHTFMGEPMVQIKWGSHSVMVRMEEIETL